MEKLRYNWERKNLEVFESLNNSIKKVPSGTFFIDFRPKLYMMKIKSLRLFECIIKNLYQHV